jgi:hypothetical protein
MEKYPQYLARPTDGTVFSLNEDGITYSVKENKEKTPNNIHHKHTFSLLIFSGFFEVEEKDFPELEAKGKEYYEFLSWTNRSDGHGGVKGGTIEEFREYKKKFKK